MSESRTDPSRTDSFGVMVAAARNAMIHVLDLTHEDTVLVVTDAATARIGEAFTTAAAETGCVTETYQLNEADRPLADVPPELSEMLPGKTVVINALSAPTEEVPFRIKWILDIEATHRIRLGHSPGIDEAMMIEGPMNVDYAVMRDLAGRLMHAFDAAKTVHITTAAGTDIVLDIENREFLTDVHATLEHGSNLPCGEIYCAPVESGAHGELVIDGPVSSLGAPAKPVKISVADGKVVNLTCDDDVMFAKVQELIGGDEEASVIGELGIGVNPGARLAGKMLEDEKALRTAHIAFGNNQEMPGGQNRSLGHHDFLFHRPTFEVTYLDGACRTLIADGEFLI